MYCKYIFIPITVFYLLIGVTMNHKNILKTTLELTEPKSNTIETKYTKLDKKIYLIPKLTYEGKWDTVTMQFGGSFGIS